MPRLPEASNIKGTYVEPFAGSAAVFFALQPRKAILSDANRELIQLYKGIKNYSQKVWGYYENFPQTKEAYYEIREAEDDNKNLAYRSARLLYLNRTCFKGMWRHNRNGKFNVGYGGQDRRWVVNKKALKAVAQSLKKATIKKADFEQVVDSCKEGDFIFLDPPYKPRKKEMNHTHYACGKFTFAQYKKLARSLKRANKRKVKWALTISSHPDIVKLFRGNKVIALRRGTGNRLGIRAKKTGEVFICNY